MKLIKKIKLPFQQAHNLFKWGPVPGLFHYVALFTEVHYKYFRKKFVVNWPETFFLFRDGRMFWTNETKAVHEAGEKLFLQFLLPIKTRKAVYQKWLGTVDALQLIETKIDQTNLNTISNQHLLEFWKQLNEIFKVFWIDGSMPELANYGSTQYLEKKLKELLENSDEIDSLMEILTAPLKLSFYQEEEIDLLNSNNIKDHQKRFFWLQNSYGGTQILSVDFFEKRKKKLPENLKQVFEKKLLKTQEDKKNLIQKYHLPEEIIKIGTAISEGIEWQDERKKWIFITLHYVDVVLREVATRFEYDFIELHHLWHHEIAEIIEGKSLHQTLEKRKNGFGFQFFKTCKELSSDQVNDIWTIFDHHDHAVKPEIIKGTVASKGFNKVVIAKAKIVLDPMKVDDFTDGDILIAPMTSPEYIFVMRKAAAIITDTGGLTSHAAIVSRELGIPCVVGTKVATKVFSDGDMLEVDVAGGTIKKI